MDVVNIHHAKTHLSRLVERAASGESFVIAKSGKPMVKVVALEGREAGSGQRRIGFLKGSIEIPKDFDRMGAAEIEQLFGSAR